MPNPFTAPGRTPADNRPLCPWETPAHDAWYAKVDHSEDAYQAYVTHLRENPDIRQAGQVVLITGPEGCGKTAWTHRAASWTKTFLERQYAPLTAHIVDLTADGRVGDDTATRVKHVIARLLDDLDFLGIFSTAEQDGLERRRDDPATLCPYLSKIVRVKNIALLVLLPPSELAEEVHQYLRLVQRQVLFFCESSYDNVAGAVPSLSVAGAKPLAHFAVDVLDERDGWEFVSHRLALANANGLVVPAIDQATIQQFMQTRIKGRGRTTIRELQITCEHVLDTAIRASRNQVSYSDFTEYYAAKAML
ncbi:hypothetical protein [Streptomyces genisteinicus]|uniref:Uncharacterized protein n=1 Tax=Streptomyces genisteinicus TaxID=2768068 RepID=A0A7H0HLR1_9ACTN|nr:hypothetical protein [Streptomyces genisteinicus]QNP61477.1 hypothetical protein IAG43_00110 [Streptomyces genisteinicus]